ncbi:MAG: hypothetical protein RQ801_04125 [Spirochaetaceae bacterium]|nr:hypothetical protein [Spirochaetaceae bacterium]
MNHNAAAVSRELSALGIDGALTAANVDVGYMAIPDVHRVSLETLNEVLSVGDPRKDPFLTEVSELFESGSHTLAYLPADRSLRRYEKLLGTSDVFRDIRFLDRIHGGGIGSVLILLVLAFLISFLTGKRHRLRILSSIVWIPLAYSSPPELLFPILLTFWLSPVNAWTSYASGGNLRKMLSVVSYGLGFYVLSVYSTVPFLMIVVPAIFSETIMILVFLYDPGQAKSTGAFKLRYLRRDHVLFEPVSLSGSFRTRSTGVPASDYSMMIRFVPAVSIGAVLIALLAPFVLADSETDTLVPAAGAALGSWSSPSAFQRLRDSKTAESLVDAGDLLASAAYQEGFLYGAEYRIPLPGDRLTIPSYREEGNLMVASETTVVEYDESWLASTLERELSTGVGRLYGSQEGPVSVTRVDVRPAAYDTLGPGSVAAAIIAVMMNFILMLMAGRGQRPQTGTNISSLSIRRRAQAA